MFHYCLAVLFRNPSPYNNNPYPCVLITTGKAIIYPAEAKKNERRGCRFMLNVLSNYKLAVSTLPGTLVRTCADKLLLSIHGPACKQTFERTREQRKQF